MLILGIESTAHTFGIGIIDAKNRKVLFNQKNQFQNDVGMDPRKLSDFHVANFDKILKSASEFLKSQNKSFSDLNLISFSRGPGMGNALKIGALVAKTLSKRYNIPIIGVNHIKAHLEIGKMLTGFKDPLFLYVSGVNTQVIAKDESGKYKIYGETEDIGLGNLLDSFARSAGLDFPGGPIIEKLAQKSNNYIELPYTIKGMNVSLAGIYSNLKQKLEQGEKPQDLCYSLQETVFAMMMEIVERAMAYTNKKEFLIVGGVACNKRLTQMAKEMCKIRCAKYDSFEMQYAMDNGAMIAWQGFVDRERASKKISNLKPMPYINIESDI
jgi:bifunctional N6-L-threonylcarbamoyladenine synthase / protein kinase Bud32